MRQDVSEAAKEEARVTMVRLGNVDANFLEPTRTEPLEDLPSFATDLIDAVGLPTADKDKLRPFFEDAKKRIETIVSSKNITERDVAFFEKYRSDEGVSPAYAKVFGLDPQDAQYPDVWV